MTKHRPDHSEMRRRGIVRTAVILVVVATLIYLVFVGQAFWNQFAS